MKVHIPNSETRRLVKSLTFTGAKPAIIAQIVGISIQELEKNYVYELSTGLTNAVHAVAEKVLEQALDGDPKSQALILKLRGSQIGWHEKQLVEQENLTHDDELAKRVAELEEKYKKEY